MTKAKKRLFLDNHLVIKTKNKNLIATATCQNSEVPQQPDARMVICNHVNIKKYIYIYIYRIQIDRFEGAKPHSPLKRSVEQSSLKCTMGELRSTVNAVRCTIIIRCVHTNMWRFIYCMLHLIDVRMLRRIYDPKRVSCINNTIFPRYLEKNSSLTTYLRLSKLIIDIVFLQSPNTMYLPGIEVSDDIVSLCGDQWWWTRLEMSWCRAITSYCLPKQIYQNANFLIQVVLLDISMFFYLN